MVAIDEAFRVPGQNVRSWCGALMLVGVVIGLAHPATAEGLPKRDVVKSVGARVAEWSVVTQVSRGKTEQMNYGWLVYPNVITIYGVTVVDEIARLCWRNRLGGRQCRV